MKKSLIFIILVSLVFLISACTINYPSINIPRQGCCAVKSGGNVIGCANVFTASNCGNLYGPLGDGIEFTPGNCTENSINIENVPVLQVAWVFLVKME